ncbi:MAG: protein phosphatase 2C domain-containing protein [Anaerolineae bacterium]|nr:protein phosphatase 2C domain-containing protein [Anaerolineae bacterium]
MSQPQTMPLDVVVAMDTDIGRKRNQNQDAIGHMCPSDPETLAELGQIFVLADGVGSLSGGDLASQYAVSTIISSYYEQDEGDPPDRLARAIAEANNLIYAEGQSAEKPRVMATTVVVAVIRGRDLVIGSVGDSPAYLMRDANARKLTLDHTLEAAQREAGTPLADDDPNGRKLVRALGSRPAVKVDIISGLVRGGDHVVLCSDGLTRYLTPPEIEQTVATFPPERAVKMLIEAANERGGADNISVIVLRLVEPPDVTMPSVSPELRKLREQQAAGQPSPGAEPVTLAEPLAEPPADNPLKVLWRLARGNAAMTIAGMAVLLVVFVVIMLVVVDFGDEQPSASPRPAASPAAPEAETATAALAASGTAHIIAAQTLDAAEADQAALAATAAVLTLTPPPPSGPLMEKDDWFRVQPGDPIPAFVEPDVNADEATPLEAGSNYLIQEMDTEAWNGPWYWVVDNQGVETRWVNGPSLHERVLRITDAGDVLPPDQQPTDIPPAIATPTRAPTLTPPPEVSDTPETVDTLDVSSTPEASAPTLAPTIAYGVESWDTGTTVVMKMDLELRVTPSVTADASGTVTAGETATIIDGPTASGEHWWWRIQFEDGRVGWVAQVLLGAP